MYFLSQPRGVSSLRIRKVNCWCCVHGEWIAFDLVGWHILLSRTAVRCITLIFRTYSYRSLKYVGTKLQHRRNPKIQYYTSIPDSQSSKQVKYTIRKRIVDEHLVRNGFYFLNNDVKWDSNERRRHKSLQASVVQCSVNMESKKRTHSELNYCTIGG